MCDSNKSGVKPGNYYDYSGRLIYFHNHICKTECIDDEENNDDEVADLWIDYGGEG